MTINIQSSRYLAGTGWGATEAVETSAAVNTRFPRVAVDADGNALAVWEELDAGRADIWANRYVPGSGWGTATLIETDDAGDASLPQIAADADGNALAVWSQHDGTRTNIWANRYAAGGGWGTAELIETDDAGAATDPQVAVDADGNALAVWFQHDGIRANIWANRYAAGVGWGTPELIENDDAGGASSPQVAVGEDGNAVAVWTQSDGMRDNTWANRFVDGTGWGSAELIETDDSSATFRAQVAVDATGNAIALWLLSGDVWANRYVAGTGWGSPELIETDAAGTADFEQIVLDADGNALAAWQENDGMRRSMWANRYVAGTGWGTAELIESDDFGDARNVEIGMFDDGSAIAVWYQVQASARNILANRFD